MENITMIAAVGLNNELGYKNQLIWHLKGDMKFFKENTMGKPIVMGINTLKSLPKLLPGREHIVLTHQDIDIEGVKIFHSISEILEYINSLPTEAMIIGGASIYQQFIDYANKMLLTQINQSAPADVYYPTFDENEWDKEVLASANENDIDYQHVEYKRKLIRKN